MVRTRIKSRAVPVLVTKVIFENPLNWTTRSFIFAKQGEYEYGRPTPEPSGELSCEGPYLAKLRKKYGFIPKDIRILRTVAFR
jgi:hypothetical protein